MSEQSPLKWVGGKHASAQRIVDAFPPPSSYSVYVEPCGGAAHVFMCKPPHNHIEIYNDLDNNLTTFWQEVQNHAGVLQAQLENHLYSRKIYYDYYRSLFDGTQLSDLERAIRWFYVLRGTGTGWIRKSPVGWNGTAQKNCVRAYRSAIDTLQDVQTRFKYVAIDNRDVLATIKRYDTHDTLFYIDPPYIGAEQYYEPSKNGFPHEELARTLQAVKGKVALSYYPDPQIDKWYAKWRRITWQQPKSSNIQLENLTLATELLLCNYPTPTQSLWDTLPNEEDSEVVA